MAIENFKWLFVSEIKGIQDYIFSTDKLRHIVGASEIVSSITGSNDDSDVDLPFYQSVLRALECKIDDDYKVMQAAAGRLMILFNNKENVNKLMAVWSVVINEYAPGTELVYDCFEINPSDLTKARETALKGMLCQRQQPSCSLPIPSLPAERCRRDSKAAIGVDENHGKREPISNEIKRKLEAAQESRKSLFKKFIPKNVDNNTIDDNYKILDNNDKWPIDFEDITGFGDKSYMAVAHVDVNSMGNFFIKLGEQLKNKEPEKNLEISQIVSQKLLESASYAAQSATRTIIEENPKLKEAIGRGCKMPLRPLVLAGDDLTFVIKAPYAIRFIESYISFFSSKAKQELTQIINDNKLILDERITELTLSAGVTFTKSKFPFKSAYELCENLCKLGKQSSERKVSTISFYRQTTSTCDDLGSLLSREFSHVYGNTTLKLTYGTYAVSKNEKGLPLITDLEAVVSTFGSLPKGALRKIASMLFADKPTVDSAWERFVDICSSRNASVMNELKSYLAIITKNNETPLWAVNNDNSFTTPLVDAVNLHSISSDFYDDLADRGNEE